MENLREITLAKDNNPKQFCSVIANGPVNPGGAQCHYLVLPHDPKATQIVPDNQQLSKLEFNGVIDFQNGHPDTVGYNGILDSALLAVLIDRAQSFAAGPYSSKEGDTALYHLEKALQAMDDRVKDRTKREVMNTYQK